MNLHRAYKIACFYCSLAVLFILIFASRSASADIYAPGATLNPNCSMGSTNCGVNLFSTFVPFTGATSTLNLNSQMLTSVGMLGIGTSTPAAALDVYGTGTAAIANFSSSSDQSALYIAANGNIEINRSSLEGVWTAGTAQLGNWNSVTYGKGLFVAVGNNAIMTSPDGAVWTKQTVPDYWNSVTYGKGLFVAVSDTNQVAISSDGVNWTVQTTPENGGWQSVTYGNGLFVAVATGADGGNTQVAMTSPDGVNWTVETTPGNGAWSSIVYGNGLFVAGSYSGQVMTSPDGTTWTLQTVPANQGFDSLTYGNGLFVGVPGGNQSITSPDGINWTVHSSALTGAAWNSVAYGEGYFVAISSGSLIATSPDGINWVSQNAPASDNWSVVYNNGFFVAVANSAVMTLRGLGGVQLEVYGSGNKDIADFASSSGQSALYIAANGNVNVSSALSVTGTTTTFGLNISNLANSFLAVDANGNIVPTSAYYNSNNGSGTSTTKNSLAVSGTIFDYIASSTPSQVATTSIGNDPRDIAVSGRYAYVTNNADNTLSVIDISNPLFPVRIATTSVGVGPIGVAVAGRYAYVANNTGDGSVSVIDISNPSAPIQIATSSSSFAPTNLVVSGRYAFVANQSGTVSTIDISNPSAPVQVANVNASGGGLGGIAVSGRYVYSVEEAGDMSVIDVSNPSSPVQVFDNSSLFSGKDPRSIAVSGRYAYVVKNGDHSVAVMDISNPTSPSIVTNVLVGNAPREINVSGRYAYVTNNSDNTISVIDISNPLSPVLVAAIPILAGSGPWGIAVSGRYAYVVNQSNGTLSVINLGGVDTGSLMAGAFEAGNINVDNNLTVAGVVSAGTALSVGSGGILSNGSLAVMGTTTTSALNISGLANTFLAVDANGNIVATTSGGIPTGVAGGALTGTYPNPSVANLSFIGISNTFLGNGAGATSSGSSHNTGIGQQALTNNTVGTKNTAVGDGALYSNIDGDYNTAVGDGALQQMTTGDSNSAFGQNALMSLATGTQNTAIGLNALYSDLHGNDNVALGYTAGYYETGSNTLYIDNQFRSGGLSGSRSSALVYGTFNADPTLQTIGFNASVGIGTTTPTSGLTVIGIGSQSIANFASSSGLSALFIASNGKIGIGTTTPSATLTVQGTPTSTLMRLVGFGAGSLSVDALGNVTESSDERLKDIMGTSSVGLTAIEGLTPINYHWNATSGLDMINEYTGFSAQNVQQNIPNAVATDSRGYLTLDDRPIIAALVNAVKQIGSFISSISNGIAHLTGIAIGTQQKPEGITMYDESTKQPYCVVINNGILLNNPGTCGPSSSANAGNTATVFNTEGNSSGNVNSSITTTAINIIPSNPAIFVGSTTAFSLIDQNNNALSTSTAWGISDLSVGTIDANGLFTASSTGTAIITAIAGPFSASTTIVVSAAPSITSDISVSTSTTTSNETVSPSISSTSTDSTANTSSSTTSQ